MRKAPELDIFSMGAWYVNYILIQLLLKKKNRFIC
jgi:hypothetical protein